MVTELTPGAPEPSPAPGPAQLSGQIQGTTPPATGGNVAGNSGKLSPVINSLGRVPLIEPDSVQPP